MLKLRLKKLLVATMGVVFGMNAAAVLAQADFQAVDVFEFFGETMDGPLPPDPAMTGAAWLNRTETRIQGRVMTTVDKSGLPYTIWVVVFNNPDYCIDGCNGEDLGLPEVQGSVYYGNSAISAQSPPGGVINVDLALTDQGLADGRFRLDDALPEPIPIWVDGITAGNGRCAEIHLVVDEHRTPARRVQGDESWVADLTTTVFPGTGLPEGIEASNHRVAVFPPSPGCSD